MSAHVLPSTYPARFSQAQIDLSALTLFGALNATEEAHVRSLLSQAPLLEAEAGDIVLDVRSSGRCLFVVLEGALGSHRSGEQPIPLDTTVAQYLPGESVGEIAVLDQESQSGTIVALTRSVVLAIDAATLWKLIEDSHPVARNLLRMLSFRVRAAHAHMRNRQKVGEFYRQLSMVDGLTGLHNRAWLNQQLPLLVETAHASGQSLSIIMVDLDHFKRFNDQHGHLLGDDALQSAAKVLNAGLRPSDFAARYGGEEMMVILPNTSKKAAHTVAERLCQRLRKTAVLADAHHPLPHITGSFGVACLESGQDDVSRLIARADAALYRAKEGGRNRVAA